MFSFFKKKSQKLAEGKKSIYLQILANIGDDGILPEDFSLADENSDDQLRLAPGALDGIFLYHSAGEDSPETADKIMPVLVHAVYNPSDQTEGAVKLFLKEHRILSFIDSLCERFSAGRTNIESEDLFNAAYGWASGSDDIELTKLGLVLTGLFDIQHTEKYRNVILNLGKYDEFTLYSATAVYGWNDEQDLIFNFAKNTNGWGRIHAIKRFNPRTRNEKVWILRYGCSNSALKSYAALDCALKGDMIDFLRQETMDADLFRGISTVTEALFNEECAMGISVYKYAYEAVRLYLSHGEKLCTSSAVLNTVITIKECYEGNSYEEKQEVVTLCSSILQQGGWDKLIVSEIENETENETENDDIEKFFSAWNAAVKLGINIDEPLFNYVQRYPLKSGFFISPLLENPEYRDRIIEFYEKTLPLEKIASGMGDSLGFGKEFEAHSCLASVIQLLQPYPMLGVRLIQAGFGSPVVRSRNSACAVMEEWGNRLDQSIHEFAPEIASQVKEIMTAETNEYLIGRYKKIIEKP